LLSFSLSYFLHPALFSLIQDFEYKEYEKIINNWRKMLTDACYDLGNILKQSYIDPSPQRRNGEYILPSVQTEKNWQSLLEHYYFNQRNILSEIPFNF